jgi:hypothetical protein
MALGGLSEAWTRVKEMLTEMGGTVVRHRLSRIDGCVDMPGVQIDDLAVPFREGRCVKKARKSAEFFETDSNVIYKDGNRNTGFSSGVGDIMLRVYEKLNEVKRQPVKMALICKRRWGDVMPECAVRVEFQLRRGALKEFQIDTVEQWYEKRAGIFKYLCTEWFRLTEKQVDRTNTTRMKTLKIWDTVAEYFEKWTHAKPCTEMAERVKPEVVVNPEQLIRQSIGCAMKALISTKRAFNTIPEFFNCMMNAVTAVIPISEFKRKAGIKTSQFNAHHPAFVLAAANSGSKWLFGES